MNNRWTRGLTAALAASTMVPSSALSTQTNKEANELTSIGADSLVQSNYDWNTDNTFSGTDGTTLLPTFENAPFSFPETGTTSANPSMGMLLNPDANYAVTTESTYNPSFSYAGNIAPFKHHALKVQEVDSQNKTVGDPAWVGYYPKANEGGINKYQDKHHGRPKLNNDDFTTMIKPSGSPGQWTYPDPIVESGKAHGKGKMTTVSGPHIIPGHVFNKHIGNNVNLGDGGKYSATGAYIPLGGHPENCQTNAAKIMTKMIANKGGKRKTHKKKHMKRKSQTKKLKKYKKLKRNKTKTNKKLKRKFKKNKTKKR